MRLSDLDLDLISESENGDQDEDKRGEGVKNGRVLVFSSGTMNVRGCGILDVVADLVGELFGGGSVS